MKNKTTNPLDDRRYEIQRMDFKEAGILLAKAAFSEMSNSNEQNGGEIVDEYMKMYDSPSRDYHGPAHVLAQITSEESLELLFEIDLALKKGGSELAFTVAKNGMKSNPSIDNDIRNCIRHDIVQSYENEGWQNEIFTLLNDGDENGKWTLHDLMNGKMQGNGKSGHPPCLVDAGFELGNAEKKAFISLAAKLFFSDEKSAAELNSKPNRGASEFFSAVKAFSCELEHNAKASFADQLGMILTLEGTIPFGEKDHFREIANKHSLLSDFQRDRLKNDLSSDKEFQKYCVQTGIQDDKQIEYFFAKTASESCRIANRDVRNFGDEDELNLFYGDLSVNAEFSGVANSGILAIENTEERAKKIIGMIGSHQENIGGFSIMNIAQKGLIYHAFSSEEFPHLNGDDIGKERINDLHNQYKINAKKVVQMHQANLLDTAIQNLFGEEYVLDIETIDSKSLDSIATETTRVFSKIANNSASPILLARILSEHSIKKETTQGDLLCAGLRWDKKAPEAMNVKKRNDKVIGASWWNKLSEERKKTRSVI
ncbi:MAG: hypothetical protein ACJA0S_001139 [Rickettsiales bacterium]|jgi:hypothetical protein